MIVDLFVIKLGGSVITNKDQEFSARDNTIKQLAKELSSVEEKFILVHGGGSFGHPVASKYEINSGYSEKSQIMGFSKTHRAMERLNSKLIDSFLENEKPVYPIQTSACTITENDEIISMDLQPTIKLLELGITPVLYGDCVFDEEKGMTILSGDQIISFIAKELKANKVIVGADTDGVYTSDPKQDKEAELIPEINTEDWEEISKSIDFSSVGDTTGGMKNKVESLLRLAEYGIDSQIVNATKKGNLKRAIENGEEIGTRVKGGTSS